VSDDVTMDEDEEGEGEIEFEEENQSDPDFMESTVGDTSGTTPKKSRSSLRRGRKSAKSMGIHNPKRTLNFHIRCDVNLPVTKSCINLNFLLF